jgi:hypothetical protein
MYRIIDSNTVGMVATRDIRPGELVFRECKSLLQGQVTSENQIDPAKVTQNLVSMLLAFEEALSEEERIRLLSLPCSKLESADASSSALLDLLKAQCGFIVEEGPRREMLKRVFQTIKLNSFTFFGSSVVYAIASYLKHSCCPNCVVVRADDDALECRAIKPITAGSELTRMYAYPRSNAYTSERRHKLLTMYEFTCHCPRCDAPGDDTRQFACFDPACSGRHYVCQPLGDQDRTTFDAEYEGVEYVEPYLLPCTACRRSPPADYEKKMFDIEVAMEFEARKWDTGAGVGEDWLVAAMQTDLRPIRYHILALRIACMQVDRSHQLWSSEHRLAHSPSPQEIQFVLSRIRLITEIDRNIFPDPNLMTLTFVGAHAEHLVMIEQYEEALVYCQRAVRMQAVLYGRECRYAHTDDYLYGLLVAFQRTYPVPTLGVCGFCEETPDNAAMKLNRCAKCKAVTYCSRGCQKAHWPVHKQKCKTS